MLLSGVVPAAAPAKQEQVNQTLTQDLASTKTAPTSVFVTHAGDKIRLGTTARDIIWDNGGDDGYGNGLSSQLDTAYPFNSQLADDFMFGQSTNIESVHWWGVFWNGYGVNPAEFKILFYLDDGTGNEPLGAGSDDPTSYAFAVYDFPSVTGTLVGSQRYEYDVTLPSSLTVDASVHYWIAIQWVGQYSQYGQWGWVMNDYSMYQLHDAMQGFPLLGTQYWTDPGYGDAAFSLSGSYGPPPADDIKVVSIDQPSTGTAASVITPKITVKNGGTNNEYFPLNYQIARPGAPEQDTLFSTGFEDWTTVSHPGWTIGFFYTISGLLFTGATGSIGFPTRSPYAGSWMAYYDCYDGSTAGEDTYMIEDTLITPGSGTTTMTAWMYHYGYDYAPPGSYVIPIITPDGSSLYYAGQSGDTWYTFDPALPSFTSAWESHSVDLTWANSYFPGGYYVGFYAISDWYLDVSLDNVDVTTMSTPLPITEYNETVDVTLAAGQTQVVTMPDWNPEGWLTVESQDISYSSVATATLANDSNQGNNLLNKDFTLSYPLFHDVKADVIISPSESGMAKTFPVSMQISNHGQNTENNFFTDCQISQLVQGDTYMDEHFDEGYFPPAGWSTDYSNWMLSYSNYAGGSVPEAEFNWAYNYGSVITAHMVSNVIDTTGVAAATLTFKHDVNDFNGQYTLEVQTTTDGGANWNTAWSTPGGPLSGTVSVSLDTSMGLGSSNFQVAWAYYGDPYNINYWYIDDCQIISSGMLPPEYTESIAVTSGLEPGATAVLTFPDWTPANLISPQTSGTMTYMATGTTMLSGDENAANNAASGPQCSLTYIHDVTVKKITSPAMGKMDDTYVHIDDGICVNAVGITASGTWETAARFTTTELAPYAGQTIDQVKVHYYGYYPEGTPEPSLNGAIKFYDAGTSSTPGALLYSEPFVSPSQVIWFYVNLTTPVSIDGSKDMWISTEWQNQQAGMFPAGCDAAPTSGKGDFAYINSAWSELGYGDWNIWGRIGQGGGGGHPHPKPTVFVKLGATAPIAGIVNNPGTFLESDMTCMADIWSFVSDPNGTGVFENSIDNIDLTPLGGEQTLAFGSYTFAEMGQYSVELNIQLAIDDKQGNNDKAVGIGVDGTVPVTTITLNPSTPSGANGWYVGNVVFTLKATDDMSGVANVYYKLDGGSAVPYSSAVTISTDGNHTISYYAVDKVGNTETERTVAIHVDKTMPYIVLNKDILINKIKYTAVVQDNMSLLDRVEFWIGPYLQFTQTMADPSGQQTAVWIFSPVPQINLTITAKAFDLAGNMAFATADPLGLNLPVGQGQQAHSQTMPQD